MSSLGGVPLFLAREEVFYVELEIRPCVEPVRRPCTRAWGRLSLSSPKEGTLCGSAELERRPSLSSTREGPLCGARKEALFAEHERRISLLTPRGGPLSLALEEALCDRPERRPRLPSLGECPLWQIREEALLAEPEKRPSASSLGGDPLRRASSKEALCEKSERRPSVPNTRGGPLLTPRGGPCAVYSGKITTYLNIESMSLNLLTTLPKKITEMEPFAAELMA